ncbi:MAG: universal stress protein, partial [Pseudomonadota bacterium]
HTLDQDRVMREKAEVCLKRHGETLGRQGIETEVLIRSGEPDPEILAEIEEKGYDLVAMATHGHNFLGDLLFGSVSRTLKHKINIPLLLLKPERRG